MPSKDAIVAMRAKGDANDAVLALPVASEHEEQ